MSSSTNLKHALSLLLLAPVALCAAAASAPALTLEVYNPGSKAMFPVSSEIVSGKDDVILIDAQFQRNDAEALVAKIKATGKRLKTVYISQGDPDYYFGLDVIHAAFPDAAIVASGPTVTLIEQQMRGKLAYWGPILKHNAPKELILPKVLEGDSLSLDGQQLQIKGLSGTNPERSYVWIPSLKTVAGGVLVNSATHVWIADTQTPASRQDWLVKLKQIEALHPAVVVPGHYLGAMPAGLEAVKFTGAYVKVFEKEAARASGSAALIQAMTAKYPALGAVPSLELSAKVIKGDMQWPQ